MGAACAFPWRNCDPSECLQFASGQRHPGQGSADAGPGETAWSPYRVRVAVARIRGVPVGGFPVFLAGVMALGRGALFVPGWETLGWVLPGVCFMELTRLVVWMWCGVRKLTVCCAWGLGIECGSSWVSGLRGQACCGPLGLRRFCV